MGATNVTPVNYHLFIWYTEGDREIIYRGGPQGGSTYADAVAAGRATSYDAPTSEKYEIDWPWSNLVTNRQEGLDANYDYQTWAQEARADLMVIVAQGPDYCGLDERFTSETRRIGELGRTHNAVSIDRIDNSNATVYTILQEMGLPLIKPAVSAPGWGTNLHVETTIPEEIERIPENTRRAIDNATRPVQEEIRWFNGLSPVEQIQQLQRMFGG